MSLTPSKNALNVAFIEPKHILPIINEPTTNDTAMNTMPKPKSAKTGTIEKTTITTSETKNNIETILVFLK